LFTGSLHLSEKVTGEDDKLFINHKISVTFIPDCNKEVLIASAEVQIVEVLK